MDVLGNGTQLYSGNTTPTCGNCGARPVGRDIAGGEIVDEIETAIHVLAHHRRTRVDSHATDEIDATTVLAWHIYGLAYIISMVFAKLFQP